MILIYLLVAAGALGLLIYSYCLFSVEAISRLHHGVPPMAEQIEMHMLERFGRGGAWMTFAAGAVLLAMGVVG